MRGLRSIVAEREETDKELPRLRASLPSFANSPLWAGFSTVRPAGSCVWAVLPLILPRSQVLDQLDRNAADTAQEKRVNKATFVHDELQDEPDDE